MIAVDGGLIDWLINPASLLIDDWLEMGGSELIRWLMVVIAYDWSTDALIDQMLALIRQLMTKADH